VALHIRFITVEAEALTMSLQLFRRRQTAETQLTGGQQVEVPAAGRHQPLPRLGLQLLGQERQGSPTPLLRWLRQEEGHRTAFEGPRKVHRGL
jgi:hypothetical protein